MVLSSPHWVKQLVLHRSTSLSLDCIFLSQGCSRRERLQPDEEGGEVVHLWVLQKAKGQDAEHVPPNCNRLHVIIHTDDTCFICIILFIFFTTGVEKALQPHYWRDVPLHVAPSKDQQQDVLHRRTGNSKKSEQLFPTVSDTSHKAYCF